MGGTFKKNDTKIESKGTVFNKAISHLRTCAKVFLPGYGLIGPETPLTVKTLTQPQVAYI